MGTRLLIRLAILVLAATAAAPSAADHPLAPRTPWGDPDLEGTWPSRNLAEAPFERLTAVEPYAVRDALVEAGVFEPLRLGVPASRVRADVNGWLDANARSLSLVVDPPDGHLPPLTEDGRRRAATAWHSSWSGGPWNGPEDLDPYDRCISRGLLGSMFPSIDTNGIEILQTPDTVAIRIENIHEARIVPLDGRKHLAPTIRSYMGDSRGRWDGDSLVIDTTNFNGRTGARLNGTIDPTSTRLHIVERLTRVSATTLDYEVTVDDPETWTAPWKVAFPLRQEPGYAFSEYACHEGNVGLAHVLSAARAAERAAR